MKPVAICKNLLSQHRSNFSKIESWEDWLGSHNIPFEYVDCYDTDIISKLTNYSALLWHYSNFVNADLMEAQNILNLAAEKGLKVYPDYNTAWHFDDKIAEMYALQSVNAPIPQSWVFYEREKCLEWLKSKAKYPLVAKLRRGSGSNNVKLIKTFQQARKYVDRMFSKGISPTQSLLYKSYSKIQSTHDWRTFVNRIKQIPNFLWARKFGKGMPEEKGYCYFQEFIENNGYDLKVVVINDKCSFLNRPIRQHDFRASGGGIIEYNKDLISNQIVKDALRIAKTLQTQCMGFDFVVDKRTGEGKIVEMCHGFDADAIYGCGGYWDSSLVWHSEAMNVQIELMQQLFGETSSK